MGDLCSTPKRWSLQPGPYAGPLTIIVWYNYPSATLKNIQGQKKGAARYFDLAVGDVRIFCERSIH